MRQFLAAHFPDELRGAGNMLAGPIGSFGLWIILADAHLEASRASSSVSVTSPARMVVVSF